MSDRIFLNEFIVHLGSTRLKYKMCVISNIILEIYNIIWEINNLGEEW
jgi:hypothetical protein